MKRVTPVLALGALLLTALPAHATDNGPAHRDSYGTKAVYSPGQNPRTYQQAPAGYTAVFTENVSRHGSRSATDGEDGDTVLALQIIPLATLMRLPGSEKAATPGRTYTYANNPWRGAEVASLASNIQWDVFRKGDDYLVRMLYNEKEVAFKAGCKPVSKGSKFYDLDELEKCFDRS
ncbi:hypothetical protein AB0N16_13275 [Streptomyces sp. NPDC051105]|uniref:hypothetical protein n=1 Tax=Streptomyces sp. NPDC051105 TaxID=3154843 RepID=UPI00343B21DA